MKQALHTIFSPFGEIMEIIAKRRLKMKGQAFIIFKTIEQALEAFKNLNGAILYGKPVEIQFAKSKSDKILKLQGKFEDTDLSKRRIKREEEYKEISENVKRKKIEEKIELNEPLMQIKEEKEQINPTNNILFIEKLAPSVNNTELEQLFKQYPGFKEVRTFPVKLYAFVEYENEFQAGVALLGLNGYKVSEDCELQISFSIK